MRKLDRTLAVAPRILRRVPFQSSGEIFKADYEEIDYDDEEEEEED